MSKVRLQRRHVGNVVYNTTEPSQHLQKKKKNPPMPKSCYREPFDKFAITTPNFQKSRD
jgi:hypothetical protein